MIETYQCSLCGGTDRQHNQYIDKGNTVVQCMRCTHIQRWPLPSQEELDASFAAETQRKTRLPAMTREQKRLHVKSDTERRKQKVLRLFDVIDLKNNDDEITIHALDIGAGEEFFADAMRHFCFMHTGEYDTLPADYGRQSFDVVTAHHVLEHVRDPLALTEQWWELVKPGGWLVIEVPNVGDVMIRECRAYRDWHFQEAHLHYFSLQTLLSLLRRLGGNPVVEVQGIQRYRQDNHEHWLNSGQPLNAPIPAYMLSAYMLPAFQSDSEWRDMLEATFACDTLYAVVTK